MKYVQKVHPVVRLVGGTKNSKQPRIIKLTTHSFKEKGFFNHKQNKKNENEKRKENLKQKIQIQGNVELSLSRFAIELLKTVNEAIEGNANFKFAYTDIQFKTV